MVVHQKWQIIRRDFTVFVACCVFSVAGSFSAIQEIHQVYYVVLDYHTVILSSEQTA